MKRILLALTALALFAWTAVAFAASRPAAWTPPARAAAMAVDDDPDMPASLANGMDKGTYLQLRGNFLSQRWGEDWNEAFQGRLAGIAQMQKQNRQLGPFIASSFWTAIGPYPIPNGQTTTSSSTVSGRVTAIVVDPANANLLYVGTAQGGVWRSSDGGLTWTPIFENAASMAIGALALAPTSPTTLYVGTGEMNLSADSFFGIGLYRIDNADTAPILNGPFNPTPTGDVIGAKTFTGRGISKILVDPADAGTIFVSTGSGIGGLGGEPFGSSPPVTALRGIYRSTNALTGSPSFTKLTVTPSSSIAPDVTGNLIVTDMVYDPTDATGNTLVAWIYGANSATNGGIYRTINALAGSPVFVQTFITTVANSRGQFTVNRVAGTTTMIVATGELASGTGCTAGNGCLRRSVDGGATWSAKLVGGGGFCGGQCFYDVPVAISPSDANVILLGGAGNGTCTRVYTRSVDAGATFTAPGVADVGMHADAHAIAFAPSNNSIVYEGSDGGIWRSTNGGASFVSINTAAFSATQFQSIDVHPTDPNFSIGGTQDNGTNWYQPAATWNRADFGDGGFAVIDQNAPDNTNVTMYHTYYNQRSTLVGYAKVVGTANAFDGNWTLLGQGANNIALTEYCNFYAPLVRGPGSPNTIYYATDRLHRSVDAGATNPTVSQAPINGVGVPISAVAIAPSNDNVRIVGTNNFNVSSGAAVNIKIMGTTTGAAVLTDWTNPTMPLAKYVGRIAIDPTNPNIAYIGFGGFNIPAGQHVWKATNVMSGTPTWVASGSGLPDVPVNAFAIDPVTPTRLFAGTDVGVYTSIDGGATWSPYTTGMPVVSVFDMAIQPVARILRVATHGRGMWERLLDTPVATQLALVGAEIVAGHPKLTWYSADGAGQEMNLYRRAVPEDWALVGKISADGTGQLTYTDADVVAGRSYEYEIGMFSGATERRLGQVWVDVPASSEAFAVRRLADAGRGPLAFSVSLTNASPAKLELLDVTGRRVASLDLASLGVGEHRVELDAAGVSSGLFWARLTQAGKFVSTRVALVR